MGLGFLIPKIGIIRTFSRGWTGLRYGKHTEQSPSGNECNSTFRECRGQHPKYLCGFSRPITSHIERESRRGLRPYGKEQLIFQCGVNTL